LIDIQFFSKEALSCFFRKIVSASALETDTVSLAVVFCALPDRQKLVKMAVKKCVSICVFFITANLYRKDYNPI